MKKKIINYLAQLTTLLLVLGFGGWALWYAYRIYRYEETNNAQVELYITPISSRIMGYAKKVNCEENQLVAKGDTLLTIEDEEYVLEHQKNQALLNKAIAELKIAEKQIQSNLIKQQQYDSEISISQIKLNNAKKEFDRVKNLLQQESITQQQYDKVEADYLLAKKNVDISKFKYQEALLEMDELMGNEQVANAKVKNCESELAHSALNLSYTIICAPYDGRIGKINIQEKQLLQNGQVITFITNEAAGKWIVANVKETQLKYFTIGKQVNIKIDAIPDRTFQGIIQSISPATGTRYSMMPPNNATGNFVRITQRIPIHIELINADDITSQLRGGMNAYVLSPKENE